MKTMQALALGARETHTIEVYRVLRFRVASSCVCVKEGRQPEIDLAFALDGAVYVREAGADDAIAWRTDAIDMPVHVMLLETFRPEQDRPIKPRDVEPPRRGADEAAAEYERMKGEGLTDGYEADRPRDKAAERKAKQWRPAWKQGNLGGIGESED